MTVVFSTECLQSDTKFDGFRSAVCSEIAQLFVEQIGAGEYDAKIRKSSFGDVTLTHVACDPVVIERSTSNIQDDDENSYFLTLQRQGCGHLHHMGRSIVLQPGDFTLVDSSQPYVITFDRPVRRLVARFGRKQLIGRGFVSEKHCGRVFHGNRGNNAIASKLLMMMSDEIDGIDIVLAHSLSAAFVDAILAADSGCDGDGDNSLNRHHSEILRRIRGVVLTNLSDPDLSTVFIAAKAGISVRYLHKIFSETGTSINKWIQDERLERSYRCLASRNHRHRTIQDIAFSNGFNDSGYFTNRFSKKYGFSPKALRERYARSQQ